MNTPPVIQLIVFAGTAHWADSGKSLLSHGKQQVMRLTIGYERRKPQTWINLSTIHKFRTSNQSFQTLPMTKEDAFSHYADSKAKRNMHAKSRKDLLKGLQSDFIGERIWTTNKGRVERVYLLHPRFVPRRRHYRLAILEESSPHTWKQAGWWKKMRCYYKQRQKHRATLPCFASHHTTGAISTSYFYPK